MLKGVGHESVLMPRTLVGDGKGFKGRKGHGMPEKL